MHISCNPDRSVEDTKQGGGLVSTDTKYRGRPAVRVLICGSRDWANEDAILAQVFTLPDQSVIIHGACPTGADAIARKWAEVLQYKQNPYPADWSRYGNQAGPIRNTRMLKESKPDLVWAFTHELVGGTGDMVNKAKRAGIEVKVFGCQEVEQLTLFHSERDGCTPMRRVVL